MYDENYTAKEERVFNPRTGQFESVLMIVTSVGKRRLIRRIGLRGEYAQTDGGEWWVHNDQQGWRPVSHESRAFRAALEFAGV